MKKILFIGASGMVAERVIPELSRDYEIIGVSRSNKTLEKYCADFYTINLLENYKTFFELIFRKYSFDIIIWNPVLYFLLPFKKISRAMIHTEFDIGVALPLECFNQAYKNDFTGNKVFIIISSLMAYGTKEKYGTYSIIKQAQIRLMEALSREYVKEDVVFKAIAFGSIPSIIDTTIIDAFRYSIENKSSENTVIKVDKDTRLL